MSVEFTDEEVAALKDIFKVLRKREGEDVIGVLMKMGAFRFFSKEEGLCELADKLGQDDISV